MAANGKSERELWEALETLDDDLLDPDLPKNVLDQELHALGVDPVALEARATAFVTEAKEQQRLSWQTRAAQRRAELQARAARARGSVSAGLSREAILARLDALRAADPKGGTAVTMAARKRRPEESTDEELRALLEEMEALRAIEGDESE